jgi:hypothetical protein
MVSVWKRVLPLFFYTYIMSLTSTVRIARSVVSFLAVLAVVFSPIAHVPFAYAAPTTLFSDGFEATPAFPNWTQADNKWQNDSNGPHTGSRLANVNGPSSTGGEILRKAISAVGYEDITFSFWYRYNGLDDGDQVFVEWTADGTIWNIAAQFNGADGNTDDVTAWTLSSVTLPPAADNSPNFAIRFRSDVNVGNDNFFLDDVTIEALPIPPPSATLTLVKVVSGGTAVASDFTLLATGPSNVSGPSGSLNVTGFTVTPGIYTLSETGGPSGYTAGTYSCVVNNNAPVVGNTLTLVDGDSATCTITNTFTEVVTPKQCLIQSDAMTLGNGVPAIPTFVHPAWTTGLSTTTAGWIWSSDAGQTATFTRAFNVDNAPTGAVLRMAVDNSYTAKLNGTPLLCDGSGILNYSALDVCTAPVTLGVNTLEIVAQNLGGPNSADLINPAGLIYELVVGGSSCSPVVEETYTIEGYKFNDKDADGIWDDAESGVKGWTINLENQETLAVLSTTTRANGSYKFVVPEGDYIVTEAGEAGWVQTVVSGDGADGDACYMSFGGDSEALSGSCDFGNHQEDVAACLIKGENLITNGSFENPIVTDNGGQWHLFSSIPGWSSTSGLVELWRNFMGPASDGLQNAELDDNMPTTLAQSVATIAGNKYKVSFDFAARPATDSDNNVLQVYADGDVLDTLTLDGTGDTIKDWVTYSYEFTAGDASTNIAFEDLGTPDSYGTLLDNVRVCLTEDNVIPETASLTIDKVVVGEGASNDQAFTFDTWLTENTSLSGAGTPVTFSELPAGTYAFSEINLPPRWAIESVSCTDGEGPENDQDPSLAGVSINLSAGEDVTCTVTNRYTPKDSNSNEENIIVKKVVTEGSDTSVVFGFDASWFDAEGPVDFSLAHGQMWDSGNLLADEYYSVSEFKAGPGWSLTKSSACVSSGEYIVDIFDDMLLHDGETITCTFVNDQDRYLLQGYVWEDSDEDGIFDDGESPLQNWELSATNGIKTFATTSDATGFYSFSVPQGTWTITEVVQSGWDATHPLPTQYVVTVPALVEEESALEAMLHTLFPVAYAAVVDTVSGLNFGNKQERGGSSSGSRGNRNGRGGGNSGGPVPQVLGAASSTIPVGAPNTGAGGTSTSVTSSLMLGIVERRNRYVL